MAGIVLIAGGTGLIGGEITRLLLQQNFEVRWLSRSAGSAGKVRIFKWDIENGTADAAAFNEVTHIINLAGAGVADHRWTNSYKREIKKSRVQSTRLLREKIQQFQAKPEAVINASAIGWYGDTGTRLATEEQPAGDDFLADVCVAWEAEAHKFKSLDIRTCIVRVGVVLAHNGGALPTMAKPVRLLAGAPLGDGQQLISWVHINDIANIFIYLMQHPSAEGAFNGAAPRPVSNEKLTEKIAKVLGKPLILPKVPAFVIKAGMGEQAAVALTSTGASADKIRELGYKFKFTKLEPALEDLLV